jgi:hypothetical protein
MLDRQPERCRKNTRLVAAAPMFRVQAVIPYLVYIDDCPLSIRQLHGLFAPSGFSL